MEVEYSLTIQDMEAFVRSHRGRGLQAKSQTRPKAARTQAVPNWLWTIVLVILLAYLWFTNGNRILHAAAWPLLFLSGVVVGGSAILFFLIWRGRVTSVVKNVFGDEHSRWLFSEWRLTISPESVTNNSVYEQVIIRWAVVWKIDVTEDHVFLFTTRDAAQIVPRRAFRDQRHFEEFLALARQYQQERGQQKPKPTGIIAGLPPQSGSFTRPDVS